MTGINPISKSKNMSQMDFMFGAIHSRAVLGEGLGNARAMDARRHKSRFY